MRPHLAPAKRATRDPKSPVVSTITPRGHRLTENLLCARYTKLVKLCIQCLPVRRDAGISIRSH